MSIKSGQRYKITNEENGLVFDMAPWDWQSGSSGGKSVLGWGPHGGRSQEWITERHDDDGQWTVRSVQHQKYLGIKNTTPEDGTLLEGLDKPHLWDIEILSDSEDHDNPRVKFWVRGTLLVVEFPREHSNPGPLQLWAARDGKNQVWVLEELA